MSDNEKGLAIEAKALLVRTRYGTLATLDEQGYPYTSATEVLSVEGDLVMFLSDLAVHTQNLLHNPKASVLLSDAFGEGQALARARMTLIGQVTCVKDRSCYRDAYLAMHPLAEDYMDFADFNFYRLKPERAYFIAGFGKMGWLTTEDLTEKP